jgi:hypothetical protein
MILTIVAINEDYINHSLNCLDLFIKNNWKIKVLTNKPEKYNLIKNVETFEHNKKIFSYFDKIIFPLQISEKYEESVLYVDADRLCGIPEDFINNFTETDSFLYYDTWPNGQTFEDFKTNTYFRAFIEYLETEKIRKFDHLLTILEWVYYIPFSNKTHDLLYEAERIKCIFEYMSILTETGYKGIGNGEGLGLSYILDKHGVEVNKFENLSLIV